MSIMKAFTLPNELKELADDLDELSYESLTDWESEFVESLQEKLIEWGAETLLTDRQWEQVDRLRNKYHL